VRKQYYFRPSKHGYYAWDIHRLIALSEGFERRMVNLRDIGEIDENYWFAGEGDIPTCRAIVEHMRLIQEVDSSYPVILSAEGHIMDGMHRVARALLDGKAMIEAVQFTITPEPDYEDVYPDDLPY
jgi:elongation factor P hydroxylase